MVSCRYVAAPPLTRCNGLAGSARWRPCHCPVCPHHHHGLVRRRCRGRRIILRLNSDLTGRDRNERVAVGRSNGDRRRCYRVRGTPAPRRVAVADPRTARGQANRFGPVAEALVCGHGGTRCDHPDCCVLPRGHRVAAPGRHACASCSARRHPPHGRGHRSLVERCSATRGRHHGLDSHLGTVARTSPVARDALPIAQQLVARSPF